jgi:hypothetical protein
MFVVPQNNIFAGKGSFINDVMVLEVEGVKDIVTTIIRTQLLKV